MVRLNRSPIPVGRRGAITSFLWFLPGFPRVEEVGGGGGRHPMWRMRCPLLNDAFPSAEQRTSLRWIMRLPLLNNMLPPLDIVLPSDKHAQPSAEHTLPSFVRRLSSTSLFYRTCLYHCVSEKFCMLITILVKNEKWAKEGVRSG